MVLSAIYIFAVVFTLDWVWTQYIMRVAEKAPVSSAFWSMGTIMLSGAAAVEYVREPWLLVPAGAGAWLATWAAVTRERNRELRRLDSQ
jgi:hypothetical protein